MLADQAHVAATDAARTRLWLWTGGRRRRGGLDGRYTIQLWPRADGRAPAVAAAPSRPRRGRAGVGNDDDDATVFPSSRVVTCGYGVATSCFAVDDSPPGVALGVFHPTLCQGCFCRDRHADQVATGPRGDATYVAHRVVHHPPTEARCQSHVVHPHASRVAVADAHRLGRRGTAEGGHRALYVHPPTARAEGRAARVDEQGAL